MLLVAREYEIEIDSLEGLEDAMSIVRSLRLPGSLFSPNQLFDILRERDIRFNVRRRYNEICERDRGGVQGSRVWEHTVCGKVRRGRRQCTNRYMWADGRADCEEEEVVDSLLEVLS